MAFLYFFLNALLLVAVSWADYTPPPRSSCGTPPEISGGSICRWSTRTRGSTLVMLNLTYCCEDNQPMSSIVCNQGNTRWPDLQECPTANGQPSPCPPSYPAKAPMSTMFGKSRCQKYQGASSLLCMNNASNVVRILPTSISEVLQMHNCWRQNVDPPAETDMPDLKWDAELAAMAERWAAQCKPYTGNPKKDHTAQNLMFIPNSRRDGPAFRYAGQNICWGENDNSWSHCIGAQWANERNHFELGEGSIDGKVVGHYTQMIWANTTYVGCSQVLCRGISPPKVMVCNYGPGGNTGYVGENVEANPYYASSS